MENSQTKKIKKYIGNMYKGTSFYADSVYADSLYTSSKNFAESEELLIKSALNEFWSNFSITDSLYAIFTLHELPRTQNSLKVRTPYMYKESSISELMNVTSATEIS